MPAQRRMTFDLDIEMAGGVVRSLDPSLELTGVNRMHGGSKEVYRLDLAGGGEPLVLKIYPDEPVWAPAKEALVAGWMAAERETPVPRSLKVDTSRAILPLRFALMTWLPGESLRHWMPDPDIGDAYRQMGALIRRIHTIRMPAYGYVRAEGVEDPRDTNADYMIGAFERVFRRFRELGGDVELGRRLETLAAARYDLLAESAGPVLCHDDFHQGNVLALREGGGLKLSGLIDFGNARAGDSLFDLAKALFCSAHEDPRSSAPLLEGYGKIDHPDPEQALWLYTLFHRASMWAWLTGLGDAADAPDGPGGLLRDLHDMAR
jgi:aminoglycoside phosphotransferase (APT) family kinase protein